MNHSPHVVILGAGASIAACPKGDANGLQLPVMTNLISVLDLGSVLAKAGMGNYAADNFELVYDRIASDDGHRELRFEIESRVQRYFASLRLPERVTIYDRLLLSLRPKDLIATFNWDPFLLQAYARNRQMPLPRVVFLHGNVYLGYCAKDKTKGYLTQVCNSCGEAFQPSPLLFPITKKEYRSHPLLSSEWNELSKFLEHAYLLTIFGYAAPSSDVSAKEILVKAWDGNQTRELAEIEVVDILSRRVLRERWQTFIVRHHWAASKKFSRTWQSNYPRRSCEAFAFATLQNAPWVSKPIPKFLRLDRLHDWILALVREEKALEKDKTPLVPFTSTR